MFSASHAWAVIGVPTAAEVPRAVAEGIRGSEVGVGNVDGVPEAVADAGRRPHPTPTSIASAIVVRRNRTGLTLFQEPFAIPGERGHADLRPTKPFRPVAGDEIITAISHSPWKDAQSLEPRPRRREVPDNRQESIRPRLTATPMKKDQRLAGEICRPASCEPLSGGGRLQRGKAEHPLPVATKDEGDGRVAQVAPSVVQYHRGVGGCLARLRPRRRRHPHVVAHAFAPVPLPRRPLPDAPPARRRSSRRGPS